MSADLEKVKADVDAQREKQRIVNAYHRVFQSPDGKLVLAHLKHFFKTEQPAFIAIGMAVHDAAFRDGQRSVVLKIEDQLSKPVVADGNIEKPKRRIIKK